LLIYRKLPNKI